VPKAATARPHPDTGFTAAGRGGLYPSGLMAEFQWWLLLVGLVAGGGLVAVVSMDGKRREQDISELERRAETGWISERLAGTGQWIDAPTVDAVLRLHREYLGLPPPDALIVEGEEAAADQDPGEPERPGDDASLPARASSSRADAASYDWLDSDPDRVSNDVRHDGRGRTDQDLPRAGEQQAAPGQEAHAGADGEQRPDR
jgi:hypothetical protein